MHVFYETGVWVSAYDCPILTPPCSNLHTRGGQGGSIPRAAIAALSRLVRAAAITALVQRCEMAAVAALDLQEAAIAALVRVLQEAAIAARILAITRALQAGLIREPRFHLGITYLLQRFRACCCRLEGRALQ